MSNQEPIPWLHATLADLEAMNAEEFVAYYGSEPPAEERPRRHPRSHARWTTEENVAVMRLDLRPGEVARLLGRSVGAVRAQRRSLRGEET